MLNSFNTNPPIHHSCPRPRLLTLFLGFAHAGRKAMDMTSGANILLWILVVACLAVVLPAAAARELSGSPAASPPATTAT
jgi:hypothetical protein